MTNEMLGKKAVSKRRKKSGGKVTKGVKKRLKERLENGKQGIIKGKRKVKKQR